MVMVKKTEDTEERECVLFKKFGKGLLTINLLNLETFSCFSYDGDFELTLSKVSCPISSVLNTTDQMFLKRHVTKHYDKKLVAELMTQRNCIHFYLLILICVVH